MYPSTTTTNGDYSFTISTIPPRRSSSLYDCNNLSDPPREHYFPTSSSSPFQLLSPHYITLEDGRILSELLQESASSDANIVVHQQYSSHGIEASLQSALEKCCKKDGDGDAENSSTKRGRTSKKDRHSKINTAQGPRDRRMRLSLEVAKKFFKVQDLLGFDKASKTVEWLLMKSKSDIQKLLPQQLIHKSSNIDDQSLVKSSSTSNHKQKKKVRKSAYLLRPLAKEAREKARARARERTMVKSSRFGCGGGGGGGGVGGGGGGDQYSKFRPCLDQNINLLGSSTYDPPVQTRTQFQLKQGIIDDNSSSMADKWSSSLNFQHPQVFSHEHQFNDFQILGNLWDGNN